mgnify:CR=1 FL=1
MGAEQGTLTIMIGGTEADYRRAVPLLDHYALYRTSMFGPSPLTRVEREAIAVVVSATNDCFY